MIDNFSKQLSIQCNVIQIHKILYVGKRVLISDNRVKPINILEVFTLMNNSKAVFLIDSSITDKNQFSKINPPVFHNFESYEKIKEEGYGKSAIFSLKKIWSLTRLDIVVPGIKKLNQKYCEDSTFYNYNYLYSIKGKSCHKTCKCVDHRYLDLFIKFTNGAFINTNIIGELNSLEIINSTLFIGRYDMCNQDIVSESAICYCAQID
ncbi:hypothetical protein SteCoe_39848 [Stentor coeruleus]|uniref:Uncharacterized protein n=1 Tax=Stentor coeruleus TaxID=5963 RepID=A0A1R2AKG9_9CILI|nr:hypothetical protein SteCoe_39848 [Stentor coeruleus]